LLYSSAFQVLFLIRAHPRLSAVRFAFPITAITRDDGDFGDLFLIGVIRVVPW
jgi:hypothetical protein